MFLQGERIYLRLIEPDDFGQSIQWLDDQETTKYMQNGLYPKTEKAMRDYFNSMQQPNLYLAIIVKGQNKYIGNIGLKNNAVNGYYSEISILIGDKSARGKGYATEAIKLLADHCFRRLNLHKLRAGAMVDNVACIKAFLKAGFKVEGEEKEAVYSDGKYRDISILTLLKSEWEVSA